MKYKLGYGERKDLQRGYERHPRTVARITDEFETTRRSNLGDIHNSAETTSTTHFDGLVSGRVGGENSIGGRNSSESIQDSRRV